MNMFATFVMGGGHFYFQMDPCTWVTLNMMPNMALVDVTFQKEATTRESGKTTCLRDPASAIGPMGAPTEASLVKIKVMVGELKSSRVGKSATMDYGTMIHRSNELGESLPRLGRGSSCQSMHFVHLKLK